ncbi:FAS1 domain-containing protein, partial [Guyanagaster necrorhizus]
MFFALVLLSTAIPALAWNNSTLSIGLGPALAAVGLTTLASQAGRLNNTSIGQGLLARLTTGNYTLFAPDNAVFSNATNTSSFPSDDNLFANALAYHIVSGSFTHTNETGNQTNATLEAENYPNVTIGRTLLDNSSVVELEGNKSQVLVWSDINHTVQMYNQPKNVSVLNSTLVGNFLVNRINGVLVIPPDVSDVLVEQNLTYLANYLNSTTITSSNGTNETITQLLDSDSIAGFTFFAPDNAAFDLARSSLNTTASVPVMENHIVNVSTIYSPSLTPSENLTSVGGEPLTFTTNSSGTFVHSGNVANARIIKMDMLCRNGVLHMLDRVLINTATNPAAATSAHEAATASAEVSTTETGPVGVPTTAGLTGSKA